MRNPVLFILLLACVLAFPACGSDTPGQTPGQTPASQSGATDQDAQLQDIFKEIETTDRSDVPALEQLYNEAIILCPDAGRVHEAYQGLASMYLYDMDPPKPDRAIIVLESYLQEYPAGPQVDAFKEELLTAYGLAGRTESLVDLYDEFFKNGYEACTLTECRGHLLNYGDALVEVGREDEAVAWYKLAYQEYPEGDIMRAMAKNNLARLGVSVE